MADQFTHTVSRLVNDSHDSYIVTSRKSQRALEITSVVVIDGRDVSTRRITRAHRGVFKRWSAMQSSLRRPPQSAQHNVGHTRSNGIVIASKNTGTLLYQCACAPTGFDSRLLIDRCVIRVTKGVASLDVDWQCCAHDDNYYCSMDDAFYTCRN